MKMSFRILGYFCILAMLINTNLFAGKDSKIRIKKDWFYVGKEKFLIKGIGYSNCRPQEQPNTKTIDMAQLRKEFEMIRDAGFNTIRTWKPLTLEELNLANEYGLFVIQGMWIEYRENFADEGRVQEIVDNLVPVVNESKQASNVLMFLVGNEPQPAQVFSVGRKKTDEFFRKLREAIRSSAKGAYVAMSNWVQCDFLNDSMWDVAALNIYNYNPDSVSHSMGYRGYVDWLKRERAPKRPLVLTEFGLSVSKSGIGKMGYGGNSLDEQKDGVLRMYEDAIDSGATGACVFEWIDEWWKNFNHPSDARVHEPSDAEEWFGICYYDEEKNIHKRPVFDALKDFNQAVVIEPANYSVVGKSVPIEINVEETMKEIKVNWEGSDKVVTLKRKSPHWFQGKISTKKQSGKSKLLIRAIDDKGQEYIRDRELFVNRKNKLNYPLSLEIILDKEVYYTENKMTSVRTRFKVVDAKGKVVPNKDINIAIYEPVLRQKLKVQKKTGADGIATHIYHVNEEGILTVSAGVEAFPGEGIYPMSDVHTSFLYRNGDCKHIKIFYSKDNK